MTGEGERGGGGKKERREEMRMRESDRKERRGEEKDIRGEERRESTRHLCKPKNRSQAQTNAETTKKREEDRRREWRGRFVPCSSSSAACRSCSTRCFTATRLVGTSSNTIPSRRGSKRPSNGVDRGICTSIAYFSKVSGVPPDFACRISTFCQSVYPPQNFLQAVPVLQRQRDLTRA